MRKKKKVPQADSVAWIGLCPCGCGAFKAALLAEDDKEIAIFGWDREGWLNFLAGVMCQIDGESNVGVVCEQHTAH